MGNYVARIEWSLLEEENDAGLWRSARFAPICTAVKPLVEQIEEIRWRRRTAIVRPA